MKALKSIILEQFYVIKKTIEDFKVQGNMPNNSLLIQSLKEDLIYLWIENQTKRFTIKSLTVSSHFPLTVFPSEANQGKLHEHDREHGSVSENKIYD